MPPTEVEAVVRGLIPDTNVWVANVDARLKWTERIEQANLVVLAGVFISTLIFIGFFGSVDTIEILCITIIYCTPSIYAESLIV